MELKFDKGEILEKEIRILLRDADERGFLLENSEHIRYLLCELDHYRHWAHRGSHHNGVIRPRSAGSSG